jgi:zinc ribbon protein
VTETLCPECGTERTDFTKVCPACGAPPAPEHRQGETPGGVRGHDLEPYITLRYIAKLFKVLAALIIVMLVGEIVTGLLIDGSSAAVTLLGEGTRLLVMAGLLWAGGDLALLMIDAGHDLRVARILLGRINAEMHRSDPGAGLLPEPRGTRSGRGAGPPAP